MIQSARSNRVVVFDLDDTLYPEHAFVISGFEAVDRELQRRQIQGFLPVAQKLFQEGVRGKVFDNVLEQLGIPSSTEMIREMVEIYRFHKPRLALFPDAQRILDQYAGQSIGLLTDGAARMQRNKVQALELDTKFAAAMFTDELEGEHGKPSPLPFQRIAAMLGRENEMERMVYVADNPKKDFVAPNRLGWTTVRIQRGIGEYSGLQPIDQDHSAQYEIQNLDELPKILKS
jgi:putative hydrolase of the HAD superfamily